MENLINLIRVIEEDRVDVVGNKNDDALKLFRAIKKSSITTKEEAADFLFPRSNHKDRYFRRTRSKLLTRLFNSILSLSEEKNKNNYNKAFVDFNKRLAAIKILMSKGHRNISTPIAISTLKESLKYHFTEISVELIEILRDNFASSGNTQELNHYQELLNQYRLLRNKEDQVKDFHRTMEYHVSLSKNPSQETKELSNNYIQQTKEILNTHSSYKLNFFAYSLFTIHAQIIKDYDLLKKYCKEALIYFEQFPFEANLPKRTFTTFLIPIFIAEQQYEEANQIIEEWIAKVKKGGINWVFLNQYKIINGFHSSSYEESQQAMEALKQFPIYKRLTEEFKVYEALLHLLAITGRLNEKKGKFKLGKFINEVALQEKDKKGMNVNILILRYIFLLQQKKWGQIIDGTESLQYYRYRYLHKEGTTKRSNEFLKLLQLLPKHSFILEPIEKDAAPILEELESTPSNLMNHLDMEIIPYTTLWEMIRELLL